MSSYKFPSSRVSNGALKETILCGILEFLAITAVGLRLWARRMKRKRLEFNDFAIIVALFFCTGLLAIAITSTVWSGKGFHTHDINPEYRSRVFVAFTAGQPVWGAANTAVKLSILHLYLTIFQDKRFRRFCYAAIAVSICYCISVFLVTILVCRPVQYNWNKKIHGTCDSRAQEVYLAAALINLTVDIFIVAMPMPMLFQLRLPTGKKVGLIAMFSLGGIICIVSMLRVIYIARMNLHDFSYTYADLGMWSIVEAQLGVMNACLPVMRPVIDRLIKSRFSQRVTPLNWRSVCSEPSTPIPVRVENSDLQRFASPVDKLYPLDTVHLVRVSDYSAADSSVDLKRARLHSGTD